MQLLTRFFRSLVLLLFGLAPVLAGAQPSAEYRLTGGDVIRITVYQNPDLTLETRVTEQGTISYPLLGTVRLGGQSPSQAEKTIADGLRNGNFVKQPQVSVVVVQVRGNQAPVARLHSRVTLQYLQGLLLAPGKPASHRSCQRSRKTRCKGFGSQVYL